MSDLTQAPNAMDAFQQQVIERLRNDIRELLPEAALTALVQRAVDETFFKERRVEGRYGGHEVRPSWFVESVTKAAGPMLEQAVMRFIEERKDVIDRVLTEFLTTERLQILLADRLALHVSMVFSSHLEQVRLLRP